MARIDLKTFLPTEDQFTALENLSGSLSLYQRSSLPRSAVAIGDKAVPPLPTGIVGDNPRISLGNPSNARLPEGIGQVFLSGDQNSFLKIYADGHDVRFKFEVFTVVVERLSSEKLGSVIEIGRIDGWQSIKCCFLFEWERPALLGEVPSHYDQVVRDGGKQDQFPENAIAAGVSMTGVVFWDDGRQAPMAALVSADWPPESLSWLQEPAQIQRFMSGCEVVDLADASAWCASLQKS